MSPTIAKPPRRRSRPGHDAGAARLVALFHRRGTVPVLAELHRARGAKFITLVNRLDLSRPTVRRTVDEAIDAGWVMRNPGYGHPLRPEYILADAGKPLGPPCQRLSDSLDELGLTDIAGRKWSMPVLHVLRHGPCRFSELRSVLPEITDRALTLALKDLVEAGLIDREIGTDYPPAPTYRLRTLARPLVRELRALAKALSG